jgi:hypothetical protein
MSFRRLSGFVAALLLSLTFLAAEASAKRVEIIISKISQKMTVKVDGQTEYVWPVSTGAPGYETPSGSYRPFRMEKDHFSKEWDDAPMPHSIFFTERGHAIHGSYYVRSLGRRASHGCVRLAPENAQTLFSLVGEVGMSNTRVTLRGGFFDFGNASRSFADVGRDIDNTVKKAAQRRPNSGLFRLFGQPKPKLSAKPVKKPKTAQVKKVADKKPAAKKPDVKKVADKKAAEKCPVKDGKKLCKKPVAKAESSG